MFVVSWFLDSTGWEEGIPDFQDSTEDRQASTTVWMLKQDWPADSEYFKGRQLFYFVDVFFTFFFTFLTQSLGRGGARWVHTDWPGSWWCHDSGHLGSGMLPSLLMKLFSLRSCWSLFHGCLILKFPLVISPTRSLFGLEMMPMRLRKLDHPRLVRLNRVIAHEEQVEKDLVHNCILPFLSAQDYVNSDPSGRRGIPISTIKQGEEPLTFTGWFQAWDPSLWEKDPLQAIHDRIKKA